MSEDRTTTITVPRVDLQLLYSQYLFLLEMPSKYEMSKEEKEVLEGLLNLLEMIFELYEKEMEDVRNGKY